jgi:hypothetical protein
LYVQPYLLNFSMKALMELWAHWSTDARMPFTHFWWFPLVCTKWYLSWPPSFIG